MSSNPLVMGYEGKQMQRDKLAPYPWSGSVSWCLAEGYGNGDQRCPISHYGSGRTLLTPHLASESTIFCRWLCLYVCLYVCHAPSNRFFFFVSRRNRAIFWPSVLHVALYKTLFFVFDLPPNPQNLLPQIWHKIACTSACIADRPEMFAPTRGLSGIADSMEPYKML